MYKEALLEKPARRILITDIAGVLNSSRDRYRIHEFDADKVQQLHNIVLATDCEIALAPEMPTDKALYERMSYARNMMCSLMNAQGFKVSVLDNISIAYINITGAMSDKEHDTTYCVLRAYDNSDCEWGCTFGTRMVRPVSNTEVATVVGSGREVTNITSEIGLTEDIANIVIAKLKTPVSPEEIPLRVYGFNDVKAAFGEMGIAPKELKVPSGVLAEAIKSDK